jgi:hypothetical protein
VKQTMVRIDSVTVRLRNGGTPQATEVGARIATQLARRTGVRTPQALESALSRRVASSLAGPRRK